MKKYPYTERLLAFIAIFFVLASLPKETKAQMLVTFEQIGLDTVVSYSGSLETTGVSSVTPSIPLSMLQITDNDSFWFLYGNNSRWGFNRTSQPVSLFTGVTSSLFPSSFSGDQFGIINSAGFLDFYAPENYSGGNISGSATFSNLDLSSLGVIEQSFSFASSPQQEVSISIVPEPSTSLLLLLAFPVLLLFRRNPVEQFHSVNSLHASHFRRH